MQKKCRTIKKGNKTRKICKRKGGSKYHPPGTRAYT